MQHRLTYHRASSPSYNCEGWLGVKHQLTYHQVSWLWYDQTGWLGVKHQLSYHQVSSPWYYPTGWLGVKHQLTYHGVSSPWYKHQLSYRWVSLPWYEHQLTYPWVSSPWYPWGAGIAQWLDRWTRDWKVAGSNPCWSGGRIFFSRVNFLCWLLFRYPFHPHVTAVARKRPRSFCQKCRWQVTAKHAYTLRMWLCMKWHGAWLYGVCRMRRDWLSLAADSCGTSHASAVSTPLWWIFQKRAIKSIYSCRITCECSESARERRIVLYKSD